MRSWPGVAAAVASLLLGGCVYYNALYNAEHLFERGEGHRLSGRDSLARADYEEVVAKAAKAFRMEPQGEWADDALLLMGRAYLRVGDLRAARAALEQAERITDDDQVRLGAKLYLGASYVEAEDFPTAITLLDEALAGLRPGHVRAEGHLWRARALLEHGEQEAGWWDLDQAASGSGAVRVAAAMERIVWGVRYDDRHRAEEGMNRLLALPGAGQRPDSVVALVQLSAERWGPSAAVQILAGADTARWSQGARGRVRLARARLMREAGDTADARAGVERVADGIGEAAVDARLDLAHWSLARARDLVDVRDAEAVLLPAEDAPEASELIAALREFDDLAEVGLSDPLGWFAAAEVARERLGAPMLARGLYLAYADEVPDDPWAAKALLAALDVTTDDGGRAWLRGRLEGRSTSPYVLAARGEPAPGLEPLEEELSRRLQEMRTR
jgi:tetratricopeptide (TPR) repeat protein